MYVDAFDVGHIHRGTYAVHVTKTHLNVCIEQTAHASTQVSLSSNMLRSRTVFFNDAGACTPHKLPTCMYVDAFDVGRIHRGTYAVHVTKTHLNVCIEQTAHASTQVSLSSNICVYRHGLQPPNTLGDLVCGIRLL